MREGLLDLNYLLDKFKHIYIDRKSTEVLEDEYFLVVESCEAKFAVFS